MSHSSAIQFHTQRRRSSRCGFCKEEGHTLQNCQTLANNECGYCHNLGHTTRRCPILAQKEDRRRERVRTAARNTKLAPDADGFTKAKGTFRRRVNRGPAVITSTQLDSFGALADSDDESHIPQKKVTVTIHRPAVATAAPVSGAWTKPLLVQKAGEVTGDKPRTKPLTVQAAGVTSTEPKRATAPKRVRWADVADEESDDDSDDDEWDMFLGSR